MNLIDTITDHSKLIAKLADLRKAQAKAEAEPQLYAAKERGADHPREDRFWISRADTGAFVCRARSAETALLLAKAMNEELVATYRNAADELEAKLRAAITTSMIGEPPL